MNIQPIVLASQKLLAAQAAAQRIRDTPPSDPSVYLAIDGARFHLDGPLRTRCINLIIAHYDAQVRIAEYVLSTAVIHAAEHTGPS